MEEKKHEMKNLWVPFYCGIVTSKINAGHKSIGFKLFNSTSFALQHHHHHHYDVTTDLPPVKMCKDFPWNKINPQGWKQILVIQGSVRLFATTTRVCRESHCMIFTQECGKDTRALWWSSPCLQVCLVVMVILFDHHVRHLSSMGYGDALWRVFLHAFVCVCI